MAFKFVDLFCGIGGFHAALSALGGQCVMASDIDDEARKIYADNWNVDPVGDIREFANESKVNVPDHDVLVGGFPCQPFSKSGYQRGMEEARGTLFWNIARIIETKKPSIVLLENVRNLVGPRHLHEWQVIVDTLQNLGYRISSSPWIVSPHKIRKEFGGRPQVRDRVLIAATRLPEKLSEISVDRKPPALNWAYSDQVEWQLEQDLPIQAESEIVERNYYLSSEEKNWIRVWENFRKAIKSDRGVLPGFPLWFDCWPVSKATPTLSPNKSLPDWKNDFINKNLDFFYAHEGAIKSWFRENSEIFKFPASRRKFEWQAQDAKSLWTCILHFRPSGIRAKKATYVPALVAMNQTTILGARKRRITVREAARLQGFPEWFRFNSQSDAVSYKQLGNAINVGVAYQALKAQVARDFDLLLDSPELVKCILMSPDNPDLILRDKKILRMLKFENTQEAQSELPLRIVN